MTLKPASSQEAMQPMFGSSRRMRARTYLFILSFEVGSSASPEETGKGFGCHALTNALVWAFPKVANAGSSCASPLPPMPSSRSHSRVEGAIRLPKFRLPLGIVDAKGQVW
mmetsp:Transcript_10919/g.16293  ORF Transcript_10919/g.16293 Transcript_10919/m.16293 type:complete len:111 (-) Transcript_10919:46-378(-)